MGYNDSEPIWTDRYSCQTVEQTSKRTLGGRLVIFTGELVAGRRITLQAATDQGWLTRDQVAAVLALAAVPGAVYLLEFGSETHNVVFDHEAGAVDMQPLLARTVDQQGDFFTGEIKLLTV